MYGPPSYVIIIQELWTSKNSPFLVRLVCTVYWLQYEALSNGKGLSRIFLRFCALLRVVLQKAKWELQCSTFSVGFATDRKLYKLKLIDYSSSVSVRDLWRSLRRYILTGRPRTTADLFVLKCLCIVRFRLQFTVKCHYCSPFLRTVDSFFHYYLFINLFIISSYTMYKWEKREKVKKE